MKPRNLQEAKAAVSEKEMVDDYFFERRVYAPSAVKVGMTHWNRFDELDELIIQMEEECGPVLDLDPEPDLYDYFYFDDHFSYDDYDRDYYRWL